MSRFYARAPIRADSDDHETIQFLRQLRGAGKLRGGPQGAFGQSCLLQIAAAAGDTAAYVSQNSDDDLKRKDVTPDRFGRENHFLKGDGEILKNTQFFAGLSSKCNCYGNAAVVHFAPPRTP